MSHFGREQTTGRAEIAYSPDGRYFSVITSRGVLETDGIESTIWLFDSAAVKNSFANAQAVERVNPKVLLKMMSSPTHEILNDDSVSGVRWAADGQTMYFLGYDKNRGRHLFVVDVPTGHLQQLSTMGQDVNDFDRVEGTVVYTAAEPVSDSELYESAGPTLSDVQIGTGLSLTDLLYPKWRKLVLGERLQHLFVARSGNPSRVPKGSTVAPVSLIGGGGSSLLSLSPSGRYVVLKNYAERIPRVWESYEPAFEDPITKIVADQPDKKPTFDVTRPRQYQLVDLERGKVSVLVDAPLGTSAGYDDETKVAWSRDEDKVALSNTFLALDQRAGTAVASPKRPCVAVVKIATLKSECVKESSAIDIEQRAQDRLRLIDLKWDSAGQLVVRYAKYEGENNSLPEVYRRERGDWSMVNGIAVRRSALSLFSHGELSITVREGVNEPPILMANDLVSGESHQIWDPNPQLAEINLGEAAVYHWHDGSGREWTGGLVKPPDYVPGHRYPLVIQTHGFNSSQFLTDGIYTTANAARALASRGITVLQVEEPSTHWGTPQEAEEDGFAGYVSAIQQLTDAGIVDSSKVGIIGFSHTGWYVLDGLIQLPKEFLAATLAEYSSESFWQYLTSVDVFSSQGGTAQAELMGGTPFGDGLQKWLAVSPGFNTDKIVTPILFELNNPVSLIGGWDIYAALRLQGKPVDMLYMRNGDHILMKPLERLASQEMNVDWFDFWLNGHEDPSPAKAEQYVRWRDLRRQHEAGYSRSSTGLNR